MRNSGLEEAQTGVKIAGRNINNLRHAEDTTLMAESEELKSLLMKVKEESEKVGLKLSSGHRTGKGQFHFNPKERQCQGMLKLLHNCTHLTH